MYIFLRPSFLINKPRNIRNIPLIFAIFYRIDTSQLSIVNRINKPLIPLSIVSMECRQELTLSVQTGPRQSDGCVIECKRKRKACNDNSEVQASVITITKLSSSRACCDKLGSHHTSCRVFLQKRPLSFSTFWRFAPLWMLLYPPGSDLTPSFSI